ncbi:TetR/AcrR family transcriptional regulator [Streptomyces sp. NBC_01483]|uniref:TetR/AcrR family transcriptional regulator n=1 Tax=Streptomyces sp. NBC_01483 TaxID=2903883 RepID=UPI002E3769BF|nr:TetR/AcrR family transcriptional regulator [Streptomyces sp. NBC_01483]
MTPDREDGGAPARKRGYGKVTVSDIARESGTAVPTVYASTGGKAAILAHLIGEGMADPIVDETLAAVRASSDPRETVAAATHGVRIDNERYSALLQVLVTAAALDETAAETLTDANRVYREALAVVAGRLADLHALREGLTQGRAKTSCGSSSATSPGACTWRTAAGHGTTPNTGWQNRSRPPCWVTASTDGGQAADARPRQVAW